MRKRRKRRRKVAITKVKLALMSHAMEPPLLAQNQREDFTWKAGLTMKLQEILSVYNKLVGEMILQTST